MPLAKLDTAKFQNHILRKDDLVITRSGTCGIAGIFQGFDKPVLPGAFLIRLRLNERADVRFFRYFFNSKPDRGHLLSIAAGAVQQNINITNLERLRVPLPPIPVQRRISNTLSTYDDLIENNTRRIKILEEMAHALYREWFIHFRLPGHKKRKLVGSPLGKIPEGWQVHNIGDVVNTLGGGTPSTQKPEYWEKGEVIWFTPSDLTAAGTMFISNSGKRISRLGLEKSSARLFPAYSVMMTSRATIGVVAINTKEACTNQGFITCIPNERVSAAQIYFWLVENREKIISIASGATYKEINRTEFREMPIVVADTTTHEGFTAKLAPICKQIEVLQKKNSNLRRTRDLLLPKLISGEIEV